MVSSFLSFCEWFFATFQAPYFVTPLRINGSSIESLYSLLKFGAGGHLSALNYGSGLTRVKARVEISRVTDSGKGYRDQVVVTPPESTELSAPTTCLAVDVPKECNCYGLPVSQYTLSAELCQSEFGGRDGSNACTLICIFLGLLFKKQRFSSLLSSTSLPPQWKTSIANAILDGNTLHDTAFEGQPINLDVEGAFENFEEELELAAYDEQQCYCPNQDLDNLVSLFTQCRVGDLQAGVMVADGRTVSVLSSVQGKFVIVDTHKHSENGALIGVSNDIASLLNWYKITVQKHFNLSLSNITCILITWTVKGSLLYKSREPS